MSTCTDCDDVRNTVDKRCVFYTLSVGESYTECTFDYSTYLSLQRNQEGHVVTAVEAVEEAVVVVEVEEVSRLINSLYLHHTKLKTKSCF